MINPRKTLDISSDYLVIELILCPTFYIFDGKHVFIRPSLFQNAVWNTNFLFQTVYLEAVGKQPSSFKILLYALPIYKFKHFLSHICKQTTCQQSLLCLQRINFSSKVPSLETLCSTISFLFPLWNELLHLHFHHYILFLHLLLLHCLKMKFSIKGFLSKCD